jgi:hypothetical protein
MSKIRSPFPSQIITFNFSSLLIVFRGFFTWIALGHIHLRFSLLFIPKANADEGGTT